MIQRPRRVAAWLDLDGLVLIGFVVGETIEWIDEQPKRVEDVCSCCRSEHSWRVQPGLRLDGMDDKRVVFATEIDVRLREPESGDEDFLELYVCQECAEEFWSLEDARKAEAAIEAARAAVAAIPATNQTVSLRAKALSAIDEMIEACASKGRAA